MSAFRIFDEDDDGCIHAGDLVDVLTSFGERFSKSEARKLVQTAAKKEDGLIDYQGESECWKYALFVDQNYIQSSATASSHLKRTSLMRSQGTRGRLDRAEKNPKMNSPCREAGDPLHWGQYLYENILKKYLTGTSFQLIFYLYKKILGIK